MNMKIHIFGQQQSHFQVTCSYMHVTLELPC
jgi:hypothetical protein